jgi:hypothetical protein
MSTYFPLSVGFIRHHPLMHHVGLMVGGKQMIYHYSMMPSLTLVVKQQRCLISSHSHWGIFNTFPSYFTLIHYLMHMQCAHVYTYLVYGHIFYYYTYLSMDPIGSQFTH